jgi:hypothetical protein
VKADTVSEWRRMFRKYRLLGYGWWWCIKTAWSLERGGRKLRHPETAGEKMTPKVRQLSAFHCDFGCANPSHKPGCPFFKGSSPTVTGKP